MTRVNQGLFSTTMEAEKRDPGNEVVIRGGPLQEVPHDIVILLGNFWYFEEVVTEES